MAVSVESEAQMADLLAAADDRGNQFSAEAARAGKAEARSGHTYVWGRTYVALKEGVGTLDSSVDDERARVRAERAASEGDPDCGLHALSGPGRGGTTVQYRSRCGDAVGSFMSATQSDHTSRSSLRRDTRRSARPTSRCELEAQSSRARLASRRARCTRSAAATAATTRSRSASAPSPVR